MLGIPKREGRPAWKLLLGTCIGKSIGREFTILFAVVLPFPPTGIKPCCALYCGGALITNLP